MKTNSVFKRSYNLWLSRLSGFAPGAAIGSEPTWARELGVSRTTVRAALVALGKAGIVTIQARKKTLRRRPTAADRFPDAETAQVADVVEKKFVQWILRGDCRPGQHINALELARNFAVSASAVRDYLTRFAQYGLLERRPGSGWVFKGFTRAFAEELFEVREMFELRSARRFAALAPDDPAWEPLRRLRDEHLGLRREAEEKFADFSELDERFHRLIIGAADNRFFLSFYDVIALIFHYHYRWNKTDEKQRNVAAIDEHLAYVAALESRDGELAARACAAHMATARLTLLTAMEAFDPHK